MWPQNYEPLGSLPVSTVAAALPIAVLLLLLGVMRKPAWMASLAALVTAAVVALAVYGMPAGVDGAVGIVWRGVRAFSHWMGGVLGDPALPHDGGERAVRTC